MDEYRFFTPQQIAEWQGQGLDSVYADIRSGKLIAHNFGKASRPRFKIREDNYEAYLKSMQFVPDPHVVVSRKKTDDTPQYV